MTNPISIAFCRGYHFKYCMFSRSTYDSESPLERTNIFQYEACQLKAQYIMGLYTTGKIVMGCCEYVFMKSEIITVTIPYEELRYLNEKWDKNHDLETECSITNFQDLICF